MLAFLLFWAVESRDDIRAEIEEAARDSQLLAEELADMLARLEDDQENISLVASELGKTGKYLQ